MRNILKRIFYGITEYPLTLEVSTDWSEHLKTSDGMCLYVFLQMLREDIINDYSIYIPKIKIDTNRSLNHCTYRIVMKGIIMAEDTAYQKRYFVSEKQLQENNIELYYDTIDVVDPISKQPAYWITSADKSRIKHIVSTTSAESYIYSYAHYIVKNNIADIFTKSYLKRYLKYVEQNYSKQIVKNLLKQLDIKSIQTVFQKLLERKVPVKDLPYIVENLANFARFDKNTDILTDKLENLIGKDE